MRSFKRTLILLVLDSPDGLDLGSLGVGAKLAVALELSSVAVALQDVLVATVTRVLVAHEAARMNKSLVKSCTHSRIAGEKPRKNCNGGEEVKLWKTYAPL